MLRLLTALLVACALALLAGCGEKAEPEITGPAVPQAKNRPAEIGDGRGGVELEQIGEFDQPVFVAQPPQGGRELFVVEQPGRIVRVDGRGRTRVFLDISNRVSCCGEQGLLSMAFAPDYERSGRFFVNYTDRDGATRVVEYQARSVRVGRGRNARRVERVVPGSARLLLRVEQPFANHNGGLVMFGPDRKLYIGIGDGGAKDDPRRNGQDLGELLGKILRIDPRPAGGKPYGIPKDNPFVDRPGARPEIAVYGVRNPWRFSFDRERGTLWIGDVGQDRFEEIDAVADPIAGVNLGWSAYEGTERLNEDERAPNALAPVHTYGRDGGCSVTGGYVVRDRELKSLYGRYLYADYCQGQLRSFTARDAIVGPVRDDRALGLQVPSISSFAEDARGRIYATSLEGPVYRLVPE